MSKQGQSQWKPGPVKEGVTRANLEALRDMGQWGMSIMDKMTGCIECPVPIEDDVQLRGLKNPMCVVLLGFSTDKVLRQLFYLKKLSVNYVVVIEPNIGIFQQTIRRKYVGDLLKNPAIDWFIGTPIGEIQTELYKTFSDYSPSIGPKASLTQNPEIILDPFVFGPGGPGGDLHQTLTQIVANASQQVFLSMGCSPDSYSRYVNSAKNFDNMGKQLNAKELKGKFWTPIIVVGAGPSMEDFIEKYHEYKLEDKAVIVACDASLRRLLKEGIKPHFVTRCERKLTSIFEGVTKEDTKDITYVQYPWCPPEFFNLFEKNVMVFRGNGICNWTEFSHLQLNGGVSSANAALELAWEIAHKDVDIFLTGIDLCFIDDSSHVKGTMVEFDVMKSKKLHKMDKCNDGQERVSIPVWQRCKGEYETALVKYKKSKPVKVYNLSEKGLELHGTTKVHWEDIKDKFKEKAHILPKIEKGLKPVPKEEVDRFNNIREESIAFLKSLDKEFEELFNLLDDYMFNIHGEEQKVVKKVRGVFDPIDLMKTFESFQISLENMYKNPAEEIDKFKTRHYMNTQFQNLVLDTCQLDIFKTENKANALKNTVKTSYERLKIYVRLHQDLFQTLKYYTEQMIELLEGSYADSRAMPES